MIADDPREGPTGETLAWMAGAIDGEGTIFISRTHPRQGSKNVRHVLIVRVGNADERFMAPFQRFFPGGRQTHRFNNGRWKSVHLWTLTGAKAASFLRGVRPHLVIKGEQADLGLEFYDEYRSFMKTGRHGVSSDEMTRRESLYERIRALNRKGPPATTEREDAPTGDATV